MFSGLLNHPLAPLMAGTLACALATQALKVALRAAGVRHHPATERALPLVPIIVGAVIFGVFPHELAVDELVDGGRHATHLLGAFFGVGCGYASAGVYKMALDYLPDEAASALRAEDRGGDGDG